MKTTTKKIKYLAVIVLICGCACNYKPLAENRKTANAAPPVENIKTDFENDLETMRTANFEYVFVFRRKDGAAFDAEDKKYLRENAPSETNRFISTDGGRAFIAGSKFKFPPENIEVLQVRFNIENYSAGQPDK